MKMIYAIDFLKEINLGWSNGGNFGTAEFNLEETLEVGLGEPMSSGPGPSASALFAALSLSALWPRWRIFPRLWWHQAYSYSRDFSRTDPSAWKFFPELSLRHLWFLKLPCSFIGEIVYYLSLPALLLECKLNNMGSAFVLFTIIYPWHSDNG